MFNICTLYEDAWMTTNTNIKFSNICASNITNRLIQSSSATSSGVGLS